MIQAAVRTFWLGVAAASLALMCRMLSGCVWWVVWVVIWWLLWVVVDQLGRCGGAQEAQDLCLALARVERRLNAIEGVLVGASEAQRQLSHNTVDDLAAGLRALDGKLAAVLRRRAVRRSESLCAF